MRSSQCSGELPSRWLPPAVTGAQAPAEVRPSAGSIPVPHPRPWQQGGASELTSAFAQLRASPAAAGGARGSSGRTSLLSQQLRGGAADSPGNSSADSSPTPQSALRGGPLHKRFTMRSALSAELAGLPAGKQAPVPPHVAAAPRHAPPVGVGHLLNTGRSSSNPLPLLPTDAKQQAARHTPGTASAPYHAGWPIGNASPARRCGRDGTKADHQVLVGLRLQGAAPSTHSIQNGFSPAASPGSMTSSAASPPTTPRARAPVMVPGARASLPGQGLLGHMPSGSTMHVSFDSEDDEHGSLGDLSL